MQIQCKGLLSELPRASDPEFDAKFASIFEALERGVDMNEDKSKSAPCKVCVEFNIFEVPEGVCADYSKNESTNSWDTMAHSYVGRSRIEGFPMGIRVDTMGAERAAITFSGEMDLLKARDLSKNSALFFSPVYSSVSDCTILGGEVRTAYHTYQALSPWRKVWFAFKAALFGGSK